MKPEAVRAALLVQRPQGTRGYLNLSLNELQ